MTPGLYIVGTPIGNLGDMTFRAVETLRGADVILAEDTRQTAKLLARYDLHTPMVSCHRFNEASRVGGDVRGLGPEPSTRLRHHMRHPRGSGPSRRRGNGGPG